MEIEDARMESISKEADVPEEKDGKEELALESEPQNLDHQEEAVQQNQETPQAQEDLAEQTITRRTITIKRRTRNKRKITKRRTFQITKCPQFEKWTRKNGGKSTMNGYMQLCKQPWAIQCSHPSLILKMLNAWRGNHL